jgi:hypothetical protein
VLRGIYRPTSFHSNSTYDTIIITSALFSGATINTCMRHQNCIINHISTCLVFYDEFI